MVPYNLHNFFFATQIRWMIQIQFAIEQFEFEINKKKYCIIKKSIYKKKERGRARGKINQYLLQWEACTSKEKLWDLIKRTNRFQMILILNNKKNKEDILLLHTWTYIPTESVCVEHEQENLPLKNIIIENANKAEKENCCDQAFQLKDEGFFVINSYILAQIM